jgi:type IV pilus assembly PilM-like protein
MSGEVLRVVEGVLGGGMRCGSGGTPPHGLVNGRVADVGAVSGALRQLLARAEIHETRAVVAVSDALASFRVLNLPAAATDEAVESAISRELPAGADRMATQWSDVRKDVGGRHVYAVAWDRDPVKRAADAVRAAGLEPLVVELKSACIARAVSEANCVVVDMSGSPAEIVVVNDHVPELWHSFEVSAPVAEDIVDEVVAPLRQVLRYFSGRRDGRLKPSVPILLSSDQVVSGRMMLSLAQALGHPVAPLPIPRRVPEEVRHGTYLTCLGLLMRRSV